MVWILLKTYLSVFLWRNDMKYINFAYLLNVITLLLTSLGSFGFVVLTKPSLIQSSSYILIITVLGLCLGYRFIKYDWKNKRVEGDIYSLILSTVFAYEYITMFVNMLLHSITDNNFEFYLSNIFVFSLISVTGLFLISFYSYKKNRP